MSETTSTPPVAHEAYSFACMKCGYGWEEAYDIEHYTDARGHEFVVYKAEGRRVPSPLSNPTCPNCESHRVRIMRSGRVSSVLDLMAQAYVTTERKKETGQEAEPIAAAGPTGQKAEEPKTERGPEEQTRREPHHWHLGDLLRHWHRS
ncbi:hypothetical protein ACIRNI_23670 [Streptomyces sp. NPDC093546]|uniref:hypothetical protein n=1 Tax=Streptomyces sp. NPDC093546 TaxID=3366040 RepID=UPI00381EC7A9